MLTLINTNLMKPPITPVGLEYVAAAACAAGIETDILDLCREDEPTAALEQYFRSHEPVLVGLSFRNVDDCFWPSAKWFVPTLEKFTKTIKSLTNAPVVIGGVGFSIFARQIIEYTAADFGIAGDGENALLSLYKQLQSRRHFESVDGLIRRNGSGLVSNPPAWPVQLTLPTRRDLVDNRWYFANGGQCGIETKRGCPRNCLYCADPLAKGTIVRTRKPAEIVSEINNLLLQNIDVLHICDSEFNIPREHAIAVCEEIIRQKLGDRLRWYTYMSVVPFDSRLAAIMKRAGCAGMDFTTDSANAKMLRTYNHSYTKEDIRNAVRLCRENGITVMLDLLLGGPGETADSAAETISFLKDVGPDAVGAPLGVRIYPGTGMADRVRAEGDLQTNPNIKRNYDGPVDFFRPTFYISALLGPRPAELVRDLIAGDSRFFEPMSEIADGVKSTDHNYNDNRELEDAIQKGSRGAYWDILRKLRKPA